MSKKKKTKSKKPIASKVKQSDQRNTGYREFMSGFSGYARENGIKIQGGRGSFAKKASEVWHDLRNKPAWRDNLDVILPQYISSPSIPDDIDYSPDRQVDVRDRMLAIVTEIGNEGFDNWEAKLLYGRWSQLKNVDLSVDQLIIEEEGTETIVNLSTEDAAGAMQQIMKFDRDERGGTSDELKAFDYDRAEFNEDGGINVIFKLVFSSIYEKRVHEDVKFDWQQETRDKYGIGKREEGEVPTEKEKKKTGAEPKAEPKTSSREARLNELIKLKSSYMEDIKFAKEMGEDYSEDYARLKKIKAEIDTY